MDIRDQHPKEQICFKHNLPVVMFNSDPKIGACCLICLQKLPGMKLADQVFNQQQQTYDKAKQKIDESLDLLKQFLDYLLVYEENIVSSLDKVKQFILHQIDTFNQQQSKLDFVFSNQSKSIDNLEKLVINQQKFNQDVKDQLYKQLECFQQRFSDTRQLLTIIGKNETIKMKNQQIIIQEQKVESQSIPQKLTYELIKESIIKQENKSYAFAFNKDNSILVVASQEEIIIYEFIMGKILKEMQRLQNYTDSVHCLQFMKNSNSFVTSSQDHSIIIWGLNSNNKYYAKYVLKKHVESVLCTVMNKNEQYIISGSVDNTLKFWKKVAMPMPNWICSQSINTKDSVLNMSFNEMEDKLITCQQQQYDKSSSVQILVLQKDQKWSILQTLDFSGYSQRLCYTFGDQFLMQKRTSNSLEIYLYDANKKEFKAVSQVQMQQILYSDEFFQSQFIKPLNILTVKNGEFLNIFKVYENYKYELLQTLQFEHSNLFGRISDDGQYLVTWDESSKQIQIRKMKYQQ